MPDVFSLPVITQIALGSGYLAYVVAYSGIRQHDSTADAVFKSAAFGLIATAVLYLVPAPMFWRGLLAVLWTIVAGAFWRWGGMAATAWVLRGLGISHSDDIPTAWISIVAKNASFRPSQVTVDTSDGRVLLCEDTRPFQDSPHGPVTFGLTGDVALYVTSEMNPEGEWFEKAGVQHAEGDLLTYVPASNIKRVEIRYWSRKTSAMAAAVEEANSAASVEAPPA